MLKWAERWRLYFFALQTQTGRQRRLLTTTCISEANNREVVTQPAVWKEGEDCPSHLAETSLNLRDISFFGDLAKNRRENDGCCEAPFLLTVRTDCTDENHFCHKMPRETFHMILAIRYLAMGEGGGNTDLSLVTPCGSLKMHTDHDSKQCLTNGKTRNIAWSNW